MKQKIGVQNYIVTQLDKLVETAEFLKNVYLGDFGENS